MKCFIHLTDEGIAVCKKCGKAMCMNCSAYSNHSGICPECRRDEFIKEREDKQLERKQNKTAFYSTIVLAVIITFAVIWASVTLYPVLLFFLVGSFFFVNHAITLSKRDKEIEKEIAALTTEIDKLSAALKRGASII